MISECRNLKQLHVSGATSMDDETLTQIVFGTPLLTVLDISYCKLVRFFSISLILSFSTLAVINQVFLTGFWEGRGTYV